MRRFFYFLFTLGIILLPGFSASARQDSPTPTVSPPGIIIDSPAPGQALQGLISITGDTAIEGFLSSELAFTYANHPAQNWFLIQVIEHSASHATLAQWDTTTITDGVYDLRLLVYLQDGSSLSKTVNGLRVRNYSPVETNTPTPVTPTATPLPGDTPVPTITPTPTVTPIPPTFTPLPPNPGQLQVEDIARSLGKGALAILGVFALIGIYFSLRTMSSRG